MSRAKTETLRARRRTRPEPRRKDGLLTTGDMARLSQNTLRTVRFYEEEGLLQPQLRTDGGHRLFPLQELRKLLLVTDLRAAGLTLDEIRDMLSVKGRQITGAAAARAVIGRLEEHVHLLNTRVALLKRLSQDLEAARQHLVACSECEDPKAFPSACNGCSVLKTNGSVPDALSVLWDIEP